MLTTAEEEEVDDAGEALAEELVEVGGGITTGGVDVLCFVGLEGADVETSLMPLLLL